MKQNVTIIILTVILVLLIAAALPLYKSFSDSYSEEPIPTTVTTEPTATKEIVLTKDFTIADFSGNSVNLSNFFGKPIVVCFWATWCSSCIAGMPNFEEAYQKYGDDVHFLMVNVGDTVGEAKEYIEAKGYTMPFYHDSNYSASIAYNVSSIPRTLFINADGELVYSRVGAFGKEILENSIEAIK